jgi:putative addiction module killer protein
MRSRALSAAFAVWSWGIPATLKASVGASWKCASTLGPGYRIYYVHREAQIVLLLCGGDKRTQQRDIKRAQRLAETL